MGIHVVEEQEEFVLSAAHALEQFEGDVVDGVRVQGRRIKVVVRSADRDDGTQEVACQMG